MRVAITIEYRGTEYLGWQKNTDNKTICNEIEKCFEIIFKEKIKVIASGRTDAGVHALNQVAHVDLPKENKMTVKNLLHALNNILPKDIRITSMKEVSSNFHARYNVKSKTYLYKCYTSMVSSPLRDEYYCHYPAVLDLQKIKDCANIFVGTHNFKAFCLSGGDSESFERHILSIDVIRKKDELFFYVKGKGFLYSMVRLIVGTLLAVGQGKITLEQVKMALENGEKRFVGDKMPACGLYLYNVEY